MKLMVHERLALLDTLKDHKDNFSGLQSVRQAREALSFDAEEVEFFNLRIENGHWEWDRTRDSQRVLDAPLDVYVINLVREYLTKLNDAHNLAEAHMSLYEKFILDYRAVEA